MSYITYFCGFLWFIYSLLAYAVTASISTTPGKVLAGKTYAYVYVIFGFAASAVFIFTAIKLKRRKTYRELERTMLDMLVKNQLRTSLLEVAMKTKVKYQKAADFFGHRLKFSHGKLRINEKGVITYGTVTIIKKKLKTK